MNKKFCNLDVLFISIMSIYIFLYNCYRLFDMDIIIKLMNFVFLKINRSNLFV